MEGYTDWVSQELIAIIGAAIGLATIFVPTIRGLRKDIAGLGERTQKDMSGLRQEIDALGERTQKDMSGLRQEIAALGERVGKVELGLVDRIGKLETSLVERIARLEVATEGFIKPQSTPQ